MATSVTTPIYLRIPVELRERLEGAAENVRGYRPRGELQRVAIRSLSAGLDALYPLRLIASPKPPTKTTKKKRRGQG